MNRRNLLTTVLLIAWGIFTVNAQTVQTNQSKETKTTTTTTKKVVQSTTSDKKSATPATPAVPAKQGTTTDAKKKAVPATPATPASSSAKPAPSSKPSSTGTANPASSGTTKPTTTGTAKPSAKPVDQTKPEVAANDITGLWITAQKGTIVEFYKVGDKYNGKAVWTKQKDKDGKPLKDVNNPDKAKRNNPIVGTDLVTGLTYNPKTNTYEGGKVYQPQTGKSFNCNIKLNKDKKSMQITGGTGFISKTLTWTRTTGIPGK